jgi:hypothetical protein
VHHKTLHFIPTNYDKTLVGVKLQKYEKYLGFASGFIYDYYVAFFNFNIAYDRIYLL